MLRRVLDFTAILAFVMTLVPSARAEYRAYLLTVTDPKTGRTYSVTSTLDDLQFPMYYPLSLGNTIAMTDTWMCWGRQGESVPPCEIPPKPKGGPAPASLKSGGRASIPGAK